MPFLTPHSSSSLILTYLIVAINTIPVIFALFLTNRLTLFHFSYVDQGGGKRPGAFAIYIEPWHADIVEVSTDTDTTIIFCISY